MIPETLAEWTLDAIRGLVVQGVFENDRFDFKEKLPHSSDAKDKLRLKKTCSAFANSGGGFLVFGVKDDKDLAPESRLVGLDPVFDFPEHFGNFPASAQPSVVWSFRNPPIPLATGRALHIAHVPASKQKPHGIWDDERWCFCKRTNKGTETMSFEEIRGSFLDWGRRANELAWLRAEVERIREVAYFLNLNLRSPDGNQVRDALLSRLDSQQLKTLLVAVFAFLADDTNLLRGMHEFIDAARRVDDALAMQAAFAFQPRDRSYSRSGPDPMEAARGYLLRVINGGPRILSRLKEREL
jgi:hypothetical protein